MSEEKLKLKIGLLNSKLREADDELLIIENKYIKERDRNDFLYKQLADSETKNRNLEKELKIYEDETVKTKNDKHQTLHQIITNNMKNFNEVNNSSLELEIEKLKLLIQMKEDKNENPLLHELVNSVDRLANSVKQLSAKVDANEKRMKEMMEKMSASLVKTITDCP